MGQMESPPPGRLFCVSVRRALDATNLFGVRFEATEGKGVLRVTRPGVLIDSPARQSGEESGLTVSQVRASRFLHLPDGAQSRVTYLFSRLDAAALERLPLDRWFALVYAADGAAHYLELAEGLLRVETDSPVEEFTSPRQMLEDLRDDLSNPHLSEHTPVGPGHTPAQGLEMDGWGASLQVWDRTVTPARPTAVEAEEADEPLSTEGEEPLGVEEDDEAEAPPVLQPAPAPMADYAPLHQRNTTLVRFLRRKLMVEEQRVRLLEAQMRALGGRTGSDGG